jgi:hypothetical protein
MHDQQQSQPKPARADEGPRADHYTPLDEHVWQAWLDKNREQEKVRFATRVKVLKFGLAILLLIALFLGLAR